MKELEIKSVVEKVDLENLDERDKQIYSAAYNQGWQDGGKFCGTIILVILIIVFALYLFTL